ncbi:DEAD/DEAH box helicase [Bacteroidales bacterium]|nr:DEAD/DEAH box helicase [Bacteroidales bacterium]
MMHEFIVVITEHSKLGYCLMPYVIEKTEGKDFYIPADRVTGEKIESLKDIIPEGGEYIVKTIEEYNDNQLLKLFCKKKISTKEFLSTLNEEFVLTHIRPYIERRIQKAMRNIVQFNIPLYFKIQSNNVYEDDRVTYSPQKANAVFNFHKEPELTKYFLSLKAGDKEVLLNNKAGFVLCDNPCIVVVDKELFMFDTIDSKKLKPFFTKEFVPVSKHTEEKYYEGFIKKAIAHYPVKNKGFDIIELITEPQAIATLEYDLAGMPVLILKFKYPKGHTVLPEDKKTPKVVLDFGDQVIYHKIIRDPAFEIKTIECLKEYGLTYKYNHFSFYIESNDPNLQLFNLINWLNRYSTELQEAGIVVNANVNEVKYYTGEFELNVEFDESNDWFDINAVVEFKGFKLNFSVFRKHILSGNNRYELPNGEVFVLPEEWFARYSDFFNFAEEEEEEFLKLKKQHFVLFDETFNGLKKDKFEAILSADIENTNYDVPAGINATLRPYQLDGFSWMFKMQTLNLGVCLADDMGLGKTIQTLTLLAKTIEDNAIVQDFVDNTKSGTQLDLFSTPLTPKTSSSLPCLIILPTSLVYNWENEIIKFVPSLKVTKYLGNKRPDFDRVYKSSDIILTTYGIIRNDLEKIKPYTFLYLILDESQVIKNPKSKTYNAVVDLESKYRLVLTGTPIENSLTDLWAQLNFLNKGLLGNLNYFKNKFVTPIEIKKNEKQKNKLKQIISPFIMRRTKQEVAKDLPELTEQTVWCDMTEEQATVYNREKSSVRNQILDDINTIGIDQSAFMILQALTTLRQMANHPVLVDDEFYHKSGKVEEVIRNIEQIKKDGHKILIFSSFVKYLNLIEDIFNKRNYKYSKLVGHTKDRGAAVKEFQENDDVQIFLISIKAGGVGLNLTAADYVFILDPWWNPAVEAQAISRAHRIGQENKVFVYRFISKGTIEEKIQRLQAKKAALASELVNSNNPLKAFDKDALMNLFD